MLKKRFILSHFQIPYFNEANNTNIIHSYKIGLSALEKITEIKFSVLMFDSTIQFEPQQWISTAIGINQINKNSVSFGNVGKPVKAGLDILPEDSHLVYLDLKINPIEQTEIFVLKDSEFEIKQFFYVNQFTTDLFKQFSPYNFSPLTITKFTIERIY